MLFKRKGKLRKEANEDLLMLIKKTNERWLRQKRVIEGSIEPSDEVLYQLKLAETKYLFLLREAKHRNVSFEKIRF